MKPEPEQPPDKPPSPEEIERLGLEKLELWVTVSERFRVMSTYHRQVQLRPKPKC